ncbi:NAD(P)/FAD-dependent oxidoreductase [Virgibacillus sp. Bac330]|uniref:NAD(P)/FAD-dependent oxidoreductase n=1 Tax=Virgibacillus sp. Bac330 TaxID=2419841 RepID=UPI001F09C593|nr:FAD-dependent oxidoreductase [Virgibacillus sp. Bac330]
MTIVIIGAGIAGVYAAETMRQSGFSGRIILFDRDTNIPYDRPPLTKEFMVGNLSALDMHLREAAHFEKLSIELRLGTEIVSVNTEKRVVVEVNGELTPYDKLLLTTGSQLKKLPVKGASLQGVFYLKTLTDAEKMQKYIQDVEHVAIIGAGFIGAELASSFRSLGKEVTIIERSSLPLEHVFGKELGKYFLHLHQTQGVKVVTEDEVVHFKGESQVEEVLTAKGKQISCQAVIIGIGVEPNTSLARLDVNHDRGYVVDEWGQTSVPTIYAAGDCTMWPYKNQMIHIEHWDHAMNHGKCVANNMLSNNRKPYSAVPYFWSDQYKSQFQYFGHASKEMKTLIRGRMKEHQFTYFFLNAQNNIEAALLINQQKNALLVRRLINQEKIIQPDLLKNESIPIKETVLK